MEREAKRFIGAQPPSAVRRSEALEQVFRAAALHTVPRNR